MNEKAIAAGLEPVIDGLVALEKRVESLQLTPGPQGEPGAPGAPGAQGERGSDGVKGNDGAGIDAPQWEPGAVYRQGAVVIANMGQYFRALKDTASSPGEPEHWARVGSGGHRHRGAFDKDAVYVDGDRFVKDFGTFCVVNGVPVLEAGRGAKGERGEPGAQGLKGKDGRDGSSVIAAQTSGLKLVLVQLHGDGTMEHIEADFGPALRELVRDEVLRAIAEATA